MKDIIEIAEGLEKKRLTWLRLNLSGFLFAGGLHLIDFHWLKMGSYLMLGLQGLGVLLWLISIIQLLRIRNQVRGNEALKRLFNDELSAHNRLKTWKVGYIAMIAALITFGLVSLITSPEPIFIIKFTLLTGIASVIAASIVLEEMLSIAVFQIEIDKDRYEVWNWKHWAFFHWIVNPGVAINEVFLGQRAPKLMLIDKKSDKPLMERTYIPCPHCETMHDGRTWSGQNKTAFGHYFGLYCPTCGGIIPCLLNITSYIFLAVSYPFRFWTIDKARERWLAKQPARYAEVNLEEVSYDKVNWLRMGLKFGLIMFVMMAFIVKAVVLLFETPEVGYLEHLFDWEFIVVSAVMCLLGGVVFGYAMKYLMGPKSPFTKTKTKEAA